MRLRDGAELGIDLDDVTEATGRSPEATHARREVDDGRADADRLDDRRVAGSTRVTVPSRASPTQTAPAPPRR